MFSTELSILKQKIKIILNLSKIFRYFSSKKDTSNYNYQFLNGTSAVYIEEMYQVWEKDPTKVHASWDAFFKTGTYVSPPGVSPSFSNTQQVNQQVKVPSSTKTIPEKIEISKQKPIDNQPKTLNVEAKEKISEKNEISKQKPLDNLPKTSNVETKERISKEIEISKQKLIGNQPKILRESKEKIISQSPPKSSISQPPPKSSIPQLPPPPSLQNKLVPKEVDIRYLDLNTISDDEEHTQIYLLTQSYQHYGHLMAHVDPLGLEDNNDQWNFNKKQITVKLNSCIAKLGSMEKKIKLPFLTWIAEDTPDKKLPLEEIIKRYDDVYSKYIGHQGAYTNKFSIKQWLVRQLETPREKVTKLEKKIAIKRLIKATLFEDFLIKQWPGEIQMSLQGCESIVPALGQIIDTSSTFGVDRITMGLTFRGRMNILANVVKKPLSQIFTAYQGIQPNQIGAGDIKCQLGTTNEFLNSTSHANVRISVTANPAHLGVVGSIVCGKTRAKMFYANDVEGKRCLPVMVHGDGEISGLGVCFETVNLSKLLHYGTHGTIHLVINNQMTGTSNSNVLRSSIYCNSIGRTIDAPIIHVNGDDIPSVIYAAKLAAEYRGRFGGDVFVDVLGYRKFGISEPDSMQTEPIIYSKISEKRPVLEKFYDEMLAEKLITEGEYQTYEQAYEKSLKAAYEKSREESIIKPKHWLESSWQGFFEGKDLLYCASTGIPEDTIKHIAKVFSSPPPDRNFVIHPILNRILKGRAAMLTERKIDWAMGEAIAFGSLLKDGIHIRVSGQDVERGTFGHRHHVIHHQTSQGAKYYPLSNLYPDQAAYIVSNSSLSEYAVLGFELGYSLISPNQLVLWEAQFGDFSNNAQVIFDQFIAAGERKWIRQSGLVMSLPHGLEGMGSEHSNARLERLLTLSNDDPVDIPDANDELSSLKQLLNCNIIVANLTTPANYFHILRRQILLPFRKPLFIMNPKSLLRLPEARSSIDDISGKTEFHRLLPETGPASENPAEVKKLLFCSGKVYYDLIETREKQNLTTQIAITRVEQLAPFPYDKVQKELTKYIKATTVAWVSEEQKNTSAWFYVEPRFHFLGIHELKYIGRLSCSAPAAGYHITHKKQLLKMLEEAMLV